MTLFVTTNLFNGLTKALDEAAGGGKVQNVRRRRAINGPKKEIRMNMRHASAPLLPLLLFAICASIGTAQPATAAEHDRNRDADTIAAEFVALQYPEARRLLEQLQRQDAEEDVEEDEQPLPYPGADGIETRADSIPLEHTVLQKRILVPPRRMMKLAQMMQKQKEGAPRTKVPSTNSDETEQREDSGGAEEDEENGGRRWRQNNGGVWAKRHIKDSTSPAGFQKMDEFKNNMMRALINLRRYRR
ncbi:hypothetical protein niasHS_014229 [Heterodera schachtii]|uniref:Uncharacterized protein n=1 Tax=Heterodera schachtii TaxID=97005 RepID=A0ABD2I3V7_HETSC